MPSFEGSETNYKNTKIEYKKIKKMDKKEIAALKMIFTSITYTVRVPGKILIAEPEDAIISKGIQK